MSDSWQRLDRAYYVDDDVVLARREFDYIAEVLWTRWIAYGKPIKAPQGQEGAVFATCLSFDASEGPLLAAILEWYVANGSVQATRNSGPTRKDSPRMVLWDLKNRAKYRPPSRFLTQSNRPGTDVEPHADSEKPQVESKIERDASSRDSSRTPSHTNERTDVRTNEPTSEGAATRGKREPDPIFDALVEAMGWSPSELTKAGRGQLNAATKQLKEIGASPGEISRRTARYRKVHPDWACTPTSVAKHWPDLSGAKSDSKTDGKRAEFLAELTKLFGDEAERVAAATLPRIPLDGIGNDLDGLVVGARRIARRELGLEAKESDE